VHHLALGLLGLCRLLRLPLLLCNLLLTLQPALVLHHALHTLTKLVVNLLRCVSFKPKHVMTLSTGLCRFFCARKCKCWKSQAQDPCLTNRTWSENATMLRCLTVLNCLVLYSMQPRTLCCHIRMVHSESLWCIFWSLMGVAFTCTFANAQT